MSQSSVIPVLSKVLSPLPDMNLADLQALQKKAGVTPTTTKVDTRGNAVTLQGKQTPRSATFKTQVQPTKPVSTPLRTTYAPQAPLPSANATTTNPGKDFASDVMRMIDQMPAGPQKDKALSALGQIQSLPIDQQNSWFQSLQTEAQNDTNPQYQKVLKRANEGFADEQSGYKQAEDFANQNYQQLKGQVDFNALQAKAQNNKTLADTLSRITSDSFVQNVAGSGIIARRNQQEKYATGQDQQNLNTQVQQKEAGSQLTRDQELAKYGLNMDRSTQLQGEAQTDLGQANLVDTNSLFLTYLGNQVSDTAQQVQNNLSYPSPSSVINPPPGAGKAPPPPVNFQSTTQNGMKNSTFAQRTAARAALRLSK